MGLFRNIKITNMAYQIVYNGMKLMSAMRKENSDLGPKANEAIEHLGDELAVLARDACTTEKERSCVLKGLEQGLKAFGLSEAATQNIAAMLTPQIMAGKPESVVGNELAEIIGGANSQAFPGTEDRKQAAIKQTCLFIDASLVMVDKEVLNKETPTVGACLFFTGAADFLTQHYKLADEDFVEVAFRVLRYFGLSEKNARLFLEALSHMAQEPFGHETLIEGGKTFQNWLSEKDPNAPIRLLELVEKWKDMRL